MLAVARHGASGLLPKCDSSRPGLLLARNTEVAIAPRIYLLPLRLDARKCVDTARRIDSRAPNTPAVVACLLEPRELTVAEQIWLPGVGCAWCPGPLWTYQPRQSGGRVD